MYVLKEIKNYYIENQKSAAEEIGIAEGTLSRILNKKQECSKIMAYSITKYINPNKEIEDFFERID